MNTVFLCGFMGCGKSAAGRELASLMGRSFIDMDSYIVEKAGMSIPEIFAEKGEEHFRGLETEAVGELAETGAIVACGGGAMLRKINADIASEKGTVVYLEESFETCYSRISGDTNRPLVMNNTKEELNGIYDKRTPVYEENSSVKISGGSSPQETAEKIKAALALRK